MAGRVCAAAQRPRGLGRPRCNRRRQRHDDRSEGSIGVQRNGRRHRSPSGLSVCRALTASPTEANRWSSPIRRSRPLRGVECHRPLDRRAHSVGDSRGTQIRDRSRTDPLEVRQEILAAVALVCSGPGEQRVKHGAKGVNIGRDRRRTSCQHLGRGVGDRTGEDPRGRLESAADVREPEITEDRFAVVVQEDIVGLDVADITAARSLPAARARPSSNCAPPSTISTCAAHPPAPPSPRWSAAPPRTARGRSWCGPRPAL